MSLLMISFLLIALRITLLCSNVHVFPHVLLMKRKFKQFNFYSYDNVEHTDDCMCLRIFVAENSNLKWNGDASPFFPLLKI